MMCFMASLFPDPECSQDGARPTATSLALCCLGWFPPFVVHHTDIRGDDGLFLRGCSVCVCLMFPRATPVNRFWQKYCKSGFFFFITSHRRLEDIESFLKTWVIGEFNHYKVHVRSAYHSSALQQSSPGCSLHAEAKLYLLWSSVSSGLPTPCPSSVAQRVPATLDCCSRSSRFSSLPTGLSLNPPVLLKHTSSVMSSPLKCQPQHPATPYCPAPFSLWYHLPV